MASRQGQLLLAGPALTDPNFAQTVTLLVQHDEEGALGLVLNHPTETTVAAALEQQGEVATACRHVGVLHRGGPCPGPLMVLHDDALRGSATVCEGVYFSVDAEDVAWLLEHHEGAMRCFVGYAGWGPGQLEGEIDTGSWLLSHASAESVFRGGASQWIDMLKLISPTHAKLAQNPRLRPPDPTMN